MLTLRPSDTRIRLASAINALCGLWLMSAPVLLLYMVSDSGAALNDMSVGAAMLIFGLTRTLAPRRAPTLSGINFVLGLWTLMSPWIYGFMPEDPRVSSSIFIGIIVMVFAGWSRTMTLHLTGDAGAKGA